MLNNVKKIKAIAVIKIVNNNLSSQYDITHNDYFFIYDYLTWIN